mmetsp:Transcript_133871/g.428036  ORF Transcript_133871/g.428036 Transcript_133871/m.428036 type:complete len:233 (+) Transcript_133871:1392-2090(+)
MRSPPIWTSTLVRGFSASSGPSRSFEAPRSSTARTSSTTWRAGPRTCCTWRRAWSSRLAPWATSRTTSSSLRRGIRRLCTPPSGSGSMPSTRSTLVRSLGGSSTTRATAGGRTSAWPALSAPPAARLGSVAAATAIAVAVAAAARSAGLVGFPLDKQLLSLRRSRRATRCSDSTYTRSYFADIANSMCPVCAVPLTRMFLFVFSVDHPAAVLLQQACGSWSQFSRPLEVGNQ